MSINTVIITDAMDLMAGFEFMPEADKTATLKTIIDKLGSYPKPYKKNDNKTFSVNLLGAYLCVSNARNSCKLALLGLQNITNAYHLISYNLELALSLAMVEAKPQKSLSTFF